MLGIKNSQLTGTNGIHSRTTGTIRNYTAGQTGTGRIHGWTDRMHGWTNRNRQDTQLDNRRTLRSKSSL